MTTAGDDVLESMLQAIVPNRISSKRQASVELVPRPMKAVRRIVKTRLSSTHDDHSMVHDPLYPLLVPDVEPIVDCDIQDIKPVVDSHLSKEFAPIEDNNYMLEECASIEDNNNTIDEQTTVVDDASLLVSTNDGGESVLRMYMLDAYEDPIKHPGIIYWLFGKMSMFRYCLFVWTCTEHSQQTSNVQLLCYRQEYRTNRIFSQTRYGTFYKYRL